MLCLQCKLFHLLLWRWNDGFKLDLECWWKAVPTSLLLVACTLVILVSQRKTLHFTSLNLFLPKISFLVNSASLSLSSTVLNPLVAVINYIFPDAPFFLPFFPPPTCPIVFWWEDLRCIWFVSTFSVQITSLFLNRFFSRSNAVWQMFPLGKSEVHVSQCTQVYLHEWLTMETCMNWSVNGPFLEVLDTRLLRSLPWLLPWNSSLGTHHLGVFQTLLWCSGIQGSILVSWCARLPVINIFNIASGNESTESICKAFQTLTCVPLLGTKRIRCQYASGNKVNVILENKHHIHVSPKVRVA